MYSHMSYRPYKVGDKVKCIAGEHNGKTGEVTSRNREEVWHAEDCLYGITWNGESEECKGLNYWALELLPE